MSAAAAVAALGGMAGPVEVVGTGRLGDQVRRLLGDRASVAVGSRPAAVIETTGRPEALRAALARVETLGTVVLAGPEPTAPLALDLYADLHVRGLVVVGVPSDGA